MAADDKKVITKRMLNVSFLRLLAEKPLAHITVTDICKGADVSRNAYYTRFTDPVDQLNKLENDVIRNLGAALMDCHGVAERVSAILDYIEDRKTVFRILLMSSDCLNLENDFLGYITGRLLSEVTPGTDAEDERFKLAFIASGVFGVIRRWIIEENSVTENQLSYMIVRYITSLR